MCDCYGHRCECCDELIPMHIADFDYKREAFRVWCGKHIDQAPTGAMIFELIAPEPQIDSEPVGWKCAILGPDVGYDGGMHPNVAGEMTETVKP